MHGLDRLSPSYRDSQRSGDLKLLRDHRSDSSYAKQKVMHIVFYISKKVLCNYAVPPKTTVTAKLYSMGADP